MKEPLYPSGQDPFSVFSEAGGKTDTLSFSDPRGTHAGADIRRDAERAVVHLLTSPEKIAVLVASEWHVQGVPFEFEFLPIYRDVAAESRCAIVTLAREEAGGLEHLLFVARAEGLPYAEYLAC